MNNIKGSDAVHGVITTRPKFGFINWFLPLYYILAQYNFVVTNIGTVIIIFAALYQYARQQELIVHRWLALFIGYCTLVQLMFHTVDKFTITTINNLVMPVLFLFIISVFIDDVNEDNLYKAFSFIGMIVMGAMYYQSLGYYFLCKPAVPITLLPIDMDELSYWGKLQGLRPSSFFTEPQAYASYIVPLLFLSLKRKNIIFAIVISLSILLSTSSQGTLIMAITWVAFVILQVKGFFAKLAAVFPAIGLICLFCTSSIFEFSINKIQAIDASNNVRLSRGFEIYGTFDVWNQLFGIGAGNLFNYVYNNLGLFDWAYAYIRDQQAYLLGYSTGVSGTLITYGIGAGLLLLIVFYKMARYDDRANITILIAFAASFFAQNMLFNAWFLFYTIFYLGICNKNLYNENYVALRSDGGGKTI